MRETHQNIAEIEEPAETQESVENKELTEEEKETIDDLWPILMQDSFEYSDDYDRSKEFFTARDKILAMGNKTLPYLQEKMLNAEHPQPYLFAKYIERLSEDSDYKLILESLMNPLVIFNPDGSSIGRLVHTLAKKSFFIRSNNPEDPRLEEISKTLVDDILLNSNVSRRLNGLKIDELTESLLWTGSKTAKEYISSSGIELDERDSNILNSPANELQMPSSSMDSLGKFRSWPEEEAKLNARLQRTSRENLFDIDDRIDSLVGDLSNDLTYHNSLLAKNEPQEFLQPSAEAYEAAKNTNKALSTFGYENSAEETLRLHLFNFLNENPNYTTEDFDKEFKKLSRLSNLELIYSREDNPLPTIGIEIEIPDNLEGGLHKGKQDLLNEIGISNTDGGLDLWEVNPKYSYSPNVQAQAIQELAKMGAIPLVKDQGKDITPLGQVDKAQDPLSLHINLGFPTEVSRRVELENTEEIAKVVNCLTYAFTTPDRIMSRKTITSFNSKDDAVGSKKNYSDKTYRHDFKVKRLEIRSVEFANYSSFRQLSETQRIGAMLFTHLKKEQGVELTEIEKEILPLWNNFSQEVQGLYEKYHLRINSVDHNKGRVAEVLEKTNIKAEARQIVTKYSKAVMSYVKPLLESTDIVKAMSANA